MKKSLLLGSLLVLALAGPAAAQHTELIGRAGLGLLRFGGADAVRTSSVNYYVFNGVEQGYTNGIFGSRLAAGFTIGGRVQHVGRRQRLVALDLGYDLLRSRTAVQYVDYFDGNQNTQYQAEGTTHLRTQSMTALLGLGQRFELGALSLDVLAGPEVAYVFGLREKGSGTYNGGTAWLTNQRRDAANQVDARLRADLTAWYRQFGLTASYSHGVFNYYRNQIGLDREVCSRTLRLGLAYRLR